MPMAAEKIRLDGAESRSKVLPRPRKEQTPMLKRAALALTITLMPFAVVGAIYAVALHQ